MIRMIRAVMVKMQRKKLMMRMIRRVMVKIKLPRKKLMAVKTMRARHRKLMTLKMRHPKTRKRMIPRIPKTNLKTVPHRTPSRHRIQKHPILNNQNRKNDHHKITKNMKMKTMM